ncbi:hypothetical protein SJR89_09585 [Aeromonas caviae]|nr:hypothetical protein [Aeromonas caviae]
MTVKHKFKFTERSKAELALLDKDVTDKLWLNFLKPILDGYTPPDELPGKYKPSWAARFLESPMRQAFVTHAREQNIHHYHFGYRIYTAGRDPEYSGDVSDGIIHTRIDNGDSEISHVILQTCIEHPSPFKYPFELTKDPALD